MSSGNAESLSQDMKEESEEKAFSMEKDLETNRVEDLEKKEKKVTLMDLIEVEKGTGGDSGVTVVADILKSKQEVKWCWALLRLRIAAFAFCLIAFFVLAADNQTVLDESTLGYYIVTGRHTYRWNDKDEFKYSFTANVIGFVYSGLQIVDLVRYLITKKHIVNPKLRGYFNIAMDQVLAYVLLSASSTAVTVVHLNYKIYMAADYSAHVFMAMANTSVALSFLAFVAFAVASIVSGFILSWFA